MSDRKPTFNEKKNQKDLVRIDILMKDIYEIIGATRSPYLKVKELIRDVRYDLDAPRKVLKNVRKAHMLAIQEAKVAGVFNEARDILEKDKNKIESNRIRKLITSYESAIKSGDYKDARKIARKIADEANVGFATNHIQIKAVKDTYGRERASFVINNLTDRMIMIRSVGISSDSASVSVDRSMEFSIPPHSQEQVNIIIERTADSVAVDLIVEYRIGEDEFNQRKSLIVNPEKR